MYDDVAQVSYSTPDGKIYLWYPGEARVIPGKWFIKEMEPYKATGLNGPIYVRVNQHCFTHSPDVYNPITRQKGLGDCLRTKAYGKYVVDIRRGDVFGLSTRTEAPFVFSRGRTTIDSLLAQMKSR